MGILSILIATITFIAICIFIGWLDEKKTMKRKIKKNAKISILDFIMSKSRRCRNCGSLNIQVESNHKLLNVHKNEKITRGLKCYIKFCRNCGHIEFFSTSIIGNSLKKLYNQSLIKMIGDSLWIFTKSFLKIFSIFHSK